MSAVRLAQWRLVGLGVAERVRWRVSIVQDVVHRQRDSGPGNRDAGNPWHVLDSADQERGLTGNAVFIQRLAES